MAEKQFRNEIYRTKIRLVYMASRSNIILYSLYKSMKYKNDVFNSATARPTD